MTPERLITTTCSVSLNLTTKIKENSLYHNYLDEQEMLRHLSLQSTFLYQSMGPNSLRSKTIFLSFFFQSQQAINIHLCKVIQMNISKVTCIISRISQQCQYSSEDCLYGSQRSPGQELQAAATWQSCFRFSELRLLYFRIEHAFFFFIKQEFIRNSKESLCKF